MTIAAFVLGVLGFGVGVASLSWNIIAFLYQGARPKLTPLVGVLPPGGPLITVDATKDRGDSLIRSAAQLPPGCPVVGVKVVNAGRAPFHIAGWAVRADPSRVSFVVMGNQIFGPDIPHDLPPGADAIFLTDLLNARALASASEAAENRPQRVVITVSSGGRTFETKAVVRALLDIGA